MTREASAGTQRSGRLAFRVSARGRVMARTTNKNSGNSAGGAKEGYEAQFWQMADGTAKEMLPELR